VLLRFRTSDSLTIAAELHLPRGSPKAAAPLVVLGHQLGKDRRSWDPLVPRLVAAGYAVLAIDHRAFGESVREVSSPSKLSGYQRNALHLDLLEAIPAVGENASVDTSRVAIVASGFSVTPAVRCAIESPAVKALAFLPGNLEIDAEEFLMANPRLPTLLIAAGGDSQGAYLMSSYGSRLTGENQSYFELGAPDSEAARWKGTDGLSEETGLIDLIVWFLERNFPAAS
jgi:dienelactone hydrolase